jgi:perosamine synthetase
LQPFYQDQLGYREGDFPIAESIADRTLALPFFNNMTEKQVEVVCETLKVMLQREQLLRRDS